MVTKFDIKVYRVTTAAGLVFASCVSVYTMFLLSKFFEAHPNYPLIFQGIVYIGSLMVGGGCSGIVIFCCT
jgi:hypothetical protein